MVRLLLLTPIKMLNKILLIIEIKINQRENLILCPESFHYKENIVKKSIFRNISRNMNLFADQRSRVRRIILLIKLIVPLLVKLLNHFRRVILKLMHNLLSLKPKWSNQ